MALIVRPSDAGVLDSKLRGLGWRPLEETSGADRWVDAASMVAIPSKAFSDARLHEPHIWQWWIPVGESRPPGWGTGRGGLRPRRLCPSAVRSSAVGRGAPEADRTRDRQPARGAPSEHRALPVQGRSGPFAAASWGR